MQSQTMGAKTIMFSTYQISLNISLWIDVHAHP